MQVLAVNEDNECVLGYGYSSGGARRRTVDGCSGSVGGESGLVASGHVTVRGEGCGSWVMNKVHVDTATQCSYVHIVCNATKLA